MVTVARWQLRAGRLTAGPSTGVPEAGHSHWSPD